MTDKEPKTSGPAGRSPSARAKTAQSSGKSRPGNKPGAEAGSDATPAALDHLEDAGGPEGDSLADELVDDISVRVAVELGHCELSVRELRGLSRGQVLQLDRGIGEPLDILVNGTLFARGEVVAIDEDQYGIRITELVRRR